MRMFSKNTEDLLARYRIGEMPDGIERETGLSPAIQHKMIRTEVANAIAKSARAMRKKEKSLFNRGLYDFRSFDDVLIKIEAWMEIRRIKRKYDRMNATGKAENKELFSWQIDSRLRLLRNGNAMTD